MSSRLLIAGISSVGISAFAFDRTVVTTKRAIVCGSATRNPVVDTYRLCEQSAISASQSGALIATAWYRIKLKQASVVVGRGKREKRIHARGSGLRVYKFVCGHPGTLNYYDPTTRRRSPAVSMRRCSPERQTIINYYPYVCRWGKFAPVPSRVS